MKCMIPGSNIKVFGRSIHCLSKIGEDLYIEPLDHGLALRTVNSSRSAYACFLFAPSFFLSYMNWSQGQNGTSSEQDEESFRCRITMKSCLSVFKSLSTLEKSVDKCQMHIDLKECRLVFLLYCKHGIVKTYNLTYQETETLQAVYSRDLCPNHIVAHSKTLADVVSGFQTSQEEISLKVNPQQISFKNYVEDEPDPSKVVHSEMFLSPSEFEDYTIGVDAEITFCLKELRAVLTFSDAAGLPVSLHFESTGKPIVFAMESEQTLEATFVLATLADLPSSQSSSQQRRVNQSSQVQRISEKQVTSMSSTLSRRHTGDGEKLHRKVKTAAMNQPSEVSFPDDLTIQSNNDHNKPSISRELGVDRESSGGVSATGSSSPVITVHSVPKSTRPSLFPELNHNQVHQQERSHYISQPNRTHIANNEVTKPDINNQQKPTSSHRGDAVSLGDNEDYDFVPGTPPSKKFKSMFFGSSEQQSQSAEPTHTAAAVVLCEDTDDEDSNAE